jgi:tryptophan-rich sensory protein
MMSTIAQGIGLVVFLAVTFMAAGIGSLATTPNIPTWYAVLAKPTWTPPNWLFGPVWAALYICMGVAAWLVWRQGGLWQARVPLGLFAVQLGLNAGWSWLFFGFHLPGAAFLEIVALFAAIAATTIAFWPRSMAASILMLPYLGWVAFAGVLNFTIWRMNP